MMGSMEALSPANLLLFLAFVMPGFLSMRVYGLLHPIEKISLKENVLEAIAFSIANFAIMSWAIFRLIDADGFAASSFNWYVLILLVFFVAPITWPVLLHVSLRALAKHGMILQRYATAWDDVFLRREPYWVVVHLKDGRRLGGRYGGKSYATLYPNPGHLYLEELWRLDDHAAFLERIPGSKGLILRPDDYHLIELFGASSNGDE
jgi:Family of unknown function (DUF6338)